MSQVKVPTVKSERASRAIGLAERTKQLPDRDNRAIEEAISREIEENGTYAFYFRDVTCKCSAGIVTVCGRVPTDRLKQVLWSLILDVEGVTEINDQLDVISSTGLSSIRPR